MAEAYYIFTDEAGAYNKRPSESFRRSHPFYIRANVRLSASDYRVFQKEIQELNTKYGVPVGQALSAVHIHSDLRIHPAMLSSGE